MSLLMDALKKAEESKRAAGEGKAADTQTLRELELAPLESKLADAPSDNSLQQPPSGVSPLPDLSLHIDSVDADLAAVSTGSTNRPRPPQNDFRSREQRHTEDDQSLATRRLGASGCAQRLFRQTADRTPECLVVHPAGRRSCCRRNQRLLLVAASGRLA